MKLDYRKTSKRWMKCGEEYLKEARNLYSKIVINLISLSTFILGFGVIWIQIRGIGNLLIGEKIIFGISIIFEIISIFFGSWALIEGNKFFNKAGENYQEKSIKLAKYIMDTGKDSGTEYPEYLWQNIEEKYSLNPWQALSQIIAFVLGIILLIIFIFLMIF